MTERMRVINDIPLTKAGRDHLFLLLVVLRWLTCDHRDFYWMNGVEGYYCPSCERRGYSGSPFYDPNFRSN